MLASSRKMSEKVNKQFGILAQIDSMLKRERVDYWIRGGWALDFILAKIRDNHADIDLVTWSRHRVLLVERLSASGFEVIPTARPERQVDFQRESIDVSFVFIERDKEGLLYSPGVPKWHWSEDSITYRVCHLGGFAARPLSPDFLLSEKLGYEAAMGRKLRHKDRESIELLNRVLYCDG
jgi:hypothetical protein